MHTLLKQKAAGFNLKPKQKAPTGHTVPGEGTVVTVGFPVPPHLWRGPWVCEALDRASDRTQPQRSRDGRTVTPRSPR